MLARQLCRALRSTLQHHMGMLRAWLSVPHALDRIWVLDKPLAAGSRRMWPKDCQSGCFDEECALHTEHSKLRMAHLLPGPGQKLSSRRVRLAGQASVGGSTAGIKASQSTHSLRRAGRQPRAAYRRAPCTGVRSWGGTESGGQLRRRAVGLLAVRKACMHTCPQHEMAVCILLGDMGEVAQGRIVSGPLRGGAQLGGALCWVGSSGAGLLARWR